MDIGFLPSASETVYAYCHKVHQLSDSDSTLNPALERILDIGVTAQAAIAKAQKYIDKVNIGGTTTPNQMQNWGINRLAFYQRELRRIAKARLNIQYPENQRRMSQVKASFQIQIKRADDYLIYAERTRRVAFWARYDGWRSKVCHKHRNDRLFIWFREGRINILTLGYALILIITRR